MWRVTPARVRWTRTWMTWPIWWATCAIWPSTWATSSLSRTSVLTFSARRYTSTRTIYHTPSASLHEYAIIAKKTSSSVTYSFISHTWNWESAWLLLVWIKRRICKKLSVLVTPAGIGMAPRPVNFPNCFCLYMCFEEENSNMKVTLASVNLSFPLFYRASPTSAASNAQTVVHPVYLNEFSRI